MVTIVWQQASDWQADIAQEVTVQIRPVEGVEFEEEIRKAVKISADTPETNLIFQNFLYRVCWCWSLTNPGAPI